MPEDFPRRIILTKHGDVLVARRVINIIVGAELIGDHEFCGGRLRTHQTSKYGGVIACDAGCNFRVHIPWPPRGYREIHDHFDLLNQPQPPADPAAADG